MGDSGTLTVEQLGAVFEDDTAIVLGAPGLAISDHLEAAAENHGAQVVRSLHELREIDPETPVVIEEFYASVWTDVYREDGQAELANTLRDHLEAGGVYLQTTPYRLQWLLSEERPIFDDVVGSLRDWTIHPISVDEDTTRELLDAELDDPPDWDDERLQQSRWTCDWRSFEDCLDEDTYAELFGDLDEYETLVPGTLIAAARWGDGNELFEDQNGILSALREMFGDVASSLVVEGRERTTGPCLDA